MSAGSEFNVYRSAPHKQPPVAPKIFPPSDFTYTEVTLPPNGYAVQLRPTALTANSGARRPPPRRYHTSIGTSCWVSAATAC
jgi:hypothetical protein